MNPNQQSLQLDIKFPLQDGRTLVQGPLSYNQDGLATKHNASFMNDPLFKEAYRLGSETCKDHKREEFANLHIEWRVYICCWAAQHAAKLEGDFVECGVNTGIMSRAVIHYVDFNKTGKTFWLTDTFRGIPEEQFSPNEKKIGLLGHNQEYYTEDIVEKVKKTFEGFNVQIIQGKVPDTLPEIKAEKVSYLSIDMNITKPEIDAINYFWDKLVFGGIVILDDYGFFLHQEQKHFFDKFAKEKGTSILSLPTGQGMILKN